MNSVKIPQALSLILLMILPFCTISAQDNTLTLFIRLRFPEEAIPSDDWFWYEAVRKATGLTVDVRFASDQRAFNAQLNLMTSQRRYPDLILTDSTTSVTSLSSLYPDALADWHPYYDQLDLLTIRGLSSAAPLFRVNGHQVALPLDTSGATSRRFVIAIREDWLDALNLDIPITVDEYTEVMRAFTEDDPDGNGQDDTYGLIAFNAPFSYLAFPALFGAFTELGSWKTRDTGEMYHVPTSNEYRDALAYIHQLHTAGYIYPTDWHESTIEDYNEDRHSGHYGIIISDFCAIFCDGNYPAFLESGGANTRFIAIDPPIGANGQSVMGLEQPAFDLMLMGSQIVENGREEQVIRFLNWLYTDEGFMLTRFGQQEINWAYDVDGSIGIVDADGRPVPRPYTQDEFRMDIQLADLVDFPTEDNLVSRYGQATTYDNGQTIVPLEILLENQDRYFSQDFSRFLPPYGTVIPFATTADLMEFIHKNDLAFMTGQRSFDEWDAYVLSVETAFGINEYIEASQSVADSFVQVNTD